MKKIYDINLPIDPSIVQVAEQYTSNIIDMDTKNKKTETLRYLRLCSLDDTLICAKQYELYEWLPDNLKRLLDNQSLSIQTEEHTNFKKSIKIISLKLDGFPKFSAVINFENVQEESLYDIKKIKLNPLADKVVIFSKFEDKIIEKLKFETGFSDLNDWEKDYNGPKTKRRVSLLILSDYELANDFVYNLFLDTFRSYLIYFYKTLILFSRKWKNMTISDILSETQKESQTEIHKLKRTHSLWNTPIESFEAMRKVTNYTYVKDKIILDNLDTTDLKYNKNIYFEGEILKRGEGPFNFSWNKRYVILQKYYITYFVSKNIGEEKQQIPLTMCLTSSLQEFEHQNYAFNICLINSNRKIWFASTDKAIINQFREQLIYVCDYLFDASQLLVIQKQLMENPSEESNIATKSPNHIINDERVKKYKDYIDMINNPEVWEFFKVKNNVKKYFLKDEINLFKRFQISEKILLEAIALDGIVWFDLIRYIFGTIDIRLLGFYQFICLFNMMLHRTMTNDMLRYATKGLILLLVHFISYKSLIIRITTIISIIILGLQKEHNFVVSNLLGLFGVFYVSEFDVFKVCVFLTLSYFINIVEGLYTKFFKDKNTVIENSTINETKEDMIIKKKVMSLQNVVSIFLFSLLIGLRKFEMIFSIVSFLNVIFYFVIVFLLHTDPHKHKIVIKGRTYIKKSQDIILAYLKDITKLSAWNTNLYNYEFISNTKFKAMTREDKKKLDGEFLFKKDTVIIELKEGDEFYSEELYFIEKTASEEIISIDVLITNKCNGNCRKSFKKLEKRVDTLSLIYNNIVNTFNKKKSDTNTVIKAREYYNNDKITCFLEGAPFLDVPLRNYEDEIDMFANLSKSESNSHLLPEAKNGTISNSPLNENQIKWLYFKEVLFRNHIEEIMLHKRITPYLSKLLYSPTVMSKYHLFDYINQIWCGAPIHLKLAYQSNGIERIKHCLCFIMAGVSNIDNWSGIPFIPYVGDTHQAFYDEGSIILYEQISQYTSAFTLYHHKNLFNMHGKISLGFSFVNSSVLITNKDEITIDLKNKEGGFDSFVIRFPSIKIENIVSSHIRIKLYGKLMIKCQNIDLGLSVDFTGTESNFYSGDIGEGKIFKISSGIVMSTLKARRNHSLLIDGKLYWDNRNIILPIASRVNRFLPSEISIRNDIEEYIKKNYADSLKAGYDLKIVQKMITLLKQIKNMY